MAISKFTKGSAVYTCRCCGINTRVTRDHSARSVSLCDDCYDLAGYENMMMDGGKPSEVEVNHIKRMVANVKKKGGNPFAAFDKELFDKL